MLRLKRSNPIRVRGDVTPVHQGHSCLERLLACVWLDSWKSDCVIGSVHTWRVGLKTKEAAKMDSSDGWNSMDVMGALCHVKEATGSGFDFPLWYEEE